MQAQLCCLGIDDGRMLNVADPAPDILRMPRTDSKGVETQYDEYERDGLTAAGLVRYVRVKHD